MGRLLRGIRGSSARAEIGRDDGGVRAHLGRRSLGNLAAEIDHDDSVGRVHDHVMSCSISSTLVPWSAIRRMISASAADSSVIEAGCRLIEQDELGTCSHRTRQFQHALAAVRQPRGAFIGKAGEASEGKQLAGANLNGGLFTAD